MTTHPYPHSQVVNRIINFVFSANDVAFSEELLIAGNQCVIEMSRCLQGHLASHSHEVAIFVLRQLDDEELCSQRHATSIIKLLSQVRNCGVGVVLWGCFLCGRGIFFVGFVCCRGFFGVACVVGVAGRP